MLRPHLQARDDMYPREQDAEPEYYTEVIERDYRDGPDERMRRHRVEVPVWLHDTSETVKNRVFGEMQTAREDGKYDDEAGGVPEVLNLQPEQLNLVHRAAAIREPTTMQESKIQWKAEVTLQGNAVARVVPPRRWCSTTI